MTEQRQTERGTRRAVRRCTAPDAQCSAEAVRYVTAPGQTIDGRTVRRWLCADHAAEAEAGRRRTTHGARLCSHCRANPASVRALASALLPEARHTTARGTEARNAARVWLCEPCASDVREAAQTVRVALADVTEAEREAVRAVCALAEAERAAFTVQAERAALDALAERQREAREIRADAEAMRARWQAGSMAPDALPALLTTEREAERAEARDALSLIARRTADSAEAHTEALRHTVRAAVAACMRAYPVPAVETIAADVIGHREARGAVYGPSGRLYGTTQRDALTLCAVAAEAARSACEHARRAHDIRPDREALPDGTRSAVDVIGTQRQTRQWGGISPWSPDDAAERATLPARTVARLQVAPQLPARRVAPLCFLAVPENTDNGTQWRPVAAEAGTTTGLRADALALLPVAEREAIARVLTAERDDMRQTEAARTACASYLAASAEADALAGMTPARRFVPVAERVRMAGTEARVTVSAPASRTLARQRREAEARRTARQAARDAEREAVQARNADALARSAARSAEATRARREAFTLALEIGARAFTLADVVRV